MPHSLQLKEDCNVPSYVVFCILLGITFIVVIIALFSIYMLIDTNKFHNLSLKLFYLCVLISLCCKVIFYLLFNISDAAILYGYFF